MKFLSHLSRIITPGRTFIPQIDGLRFIAIAAVIAYHLRLIGHFYLRVPLDQEGNVIASVFEAGHFGVHLFFVISGFILSLPFAKQSMVQDSCRIRLRDYYLRRVTRIEPPYVIHLGILFLLCGLALRHMPSHPHLYDNPNWAKYASAHILSSLIYSNGFVFGAHPYPNVVLWSLEVEVQFYLVAPFLAKVFNISSASKRRTVIVTGIIAASTVSNFAAAGAYWVWASLVGNIQFFLAGFLLADFYLTKRINFAGRSFGWDFVSLTAVATVVFVGDYHWSVYLLPWVILLGCVGGFQGRIGSWFLGKPLIVTIGGMCYTIYMYHYLMISVLFRGTIRLQTRILWIDLFIQLLIMTPIIFLVCSVLFAVFERPFMLKDWPQRLCAFIRRGKNKAGRERTRSTAIV